MNEYGSADRLPGAGRDVMLGSMDDLAQLEQRIEALCAEAQANADPRLMPKIEFTLSEGYAHALAAEARMRQLDRRLELLLDSVDPGEASELRSVVRERRHLARRLERLRSRLSALKAGFVGLRET
jgi:hypothetical protein